MYAFRTSIVIKVRQFDQYVVKVDGSGRVTLHNQKFLWKYLPVLRPQQRMGIKPDIRIQASVLPRAALPGTRISHYSSPDNVNHSPNPVTSPSPQVTTPPCKATCNATPPAQESPNSAGPQTLTTPLPFASTPGKLTRFNTTTGHHKLAFDDNHEWRCGTPQTNIVGD